MTRQKAGKEGPFFYRLHLSASENPHYYTVHFLSLFQVQSSHSERTAKGEADQRNLELVAWLKSEDGKAWMKENGVIQ